LNNEPEKLEWLAHTVQEVVDAPLSYDSPNPDAIKRALKVNKSQKSIINSITFEKKRLEAILPLAVEYKTSIIALA